MNVTLHDLMDHLKLNDLTAVNIQEHLKDVVTWVASCRPDSDLSVLQGGEVLIVKFTSEMAYPSAADIFFNRCIENDACAAALTGLESMPEKQRTAILKALKKSGLAGLLIPSSYDLLQFQKKANEYILRMKNAEIVEETFLLDFLFSSDTVSIMNSIEHVESFGLDPNARYQVAVAKATLKTETGNNAVREQYIYRSLLSQLKAQKWHIYSVHFGRMIILLFEVASQPIDKTENPQLMQKTCLSLCSQFSNIEIRAAFGNAYTPISNIKHSFEEALFTFNMYDNLHLEGSNVAEYCNLGFYQILRNTRDTLSLKEFYTSRMGVLEEYDRSNKTELLNTLCMYLENNCVLNEAAQKMFIHVNTMRYRLKKIEEITGTNLSNSKEITDFYICLYIRNYLNAKTDHNTLVQ